MTIARAILDELTEDDLAELARRLEQHLPRPSGWLNAKAAAEHLGCPVSRVRKLTMLGALPHENDGSRVLYSRTVLDDFVRAGGAKSC
jgi:hypothetical protein